MKRQWTFIRLVLTWVIMQTGILSSGQDLGQIGNQKPFAINGTLGLGFGTYNSNGVDPRARSFSYLISGAPVISIYGISFPVGIVVSDQQKTFRQPFNQYGASPRYKWLTVHLGWRSLQYSPFTLAGYAFLGAGFDANPDKLRVGFIYGRFNKAIAPDSAQPSTFYQTPSYKRTGYAGRIGFGTEMNHIDLIYLKAKDDPTSLSKALDEYGITPAENLVVGLSARYTIWKHLYFEGDIAGSIYTRDVRSDTVSDESLKDVHFVTKLLKVNSSTQLLTAAQAAVGYRGNGYGIQFQYRRVDPDYKSMGAYYFETDVENYTVAPSVSLFKRRLQLGGSFGIQHDDILKDKAAQSDKTIGSVNAAYNVQKFGFNVQYSNYGISQSRGLNPVIDTLRVARTNHNVNAMTRLSLGNSDFTHNIILVGNVQSLVDLNDHTASQTQTNSKTGNLSYQLGIVHAGCSISAIYNYTVADFTGMHTIIQGPSAGIDKQLLKSKFMLSTYWSYQLQNNNHINAGQFINGTLTASCRLSKKQALSATLNYLKCHATDASLTSFYEFRTSVNYLYSF